MTYYLPATVLFTYKKEFKCFPEKLPYRFKDIHYNIVNNITPLMPIISASSIMVMVLMGKLNTAPRQAHFIFRLLKTLSKTPIMINVKRLGVSVLVQLGLSWVKNG